HRSENIMGFKCGILGLSNVGKSTLFNALTATAAAQASNYPFSTIEPNVGEVMVPDTRLDVLARLAKSAKIKPTRLTFVDIAGLHSGALRVQPRRGRRRGWQRLFAPGRGAGAGGRCGLCGDLGQNRGGNRRTAGARAR